MPYTKENIQLYVDAVLHKLQQMKSDLQIPYFTEENCFEIVSLLDGELIFEQKWKPEWGDGIIIRERKDAGKNFTIKLPLHTSPKRDMFTIAHELGHLFLHFYYGTKRWWDSEDYFYFQDSMLTRNGTGTMEQEANYFAACLLMPEEEFKSVYAECGTIQGVADHFGVSKQAATIRRKSLKLSNLEKING
jgi:Zn-dependent peptidase ImmA (M78 family)